MQSKTIRFTGSVGDLTKFKNFIRGYSYVPDHGAISNNFGKKTFVRWLEIFSAEKARPDECWLNHENFDVFRTFQDSRYNTRIEHFLEEIKFVASYGGLLC